MNGSIDHRPDRPRPWRARYTAPDRRQRSKSFYTKAEAQRWLRAQIARMDRGSWVDPSAGQAAFRDHAETWLKGLVGIKPKTRAGYESLLRSRILPALGDHQLRRIDPASVRQWIAAMDDEGLSPSRIRQAHQVLRASLDQAVEDGLIGRNPATGVSVPTDPHREMKFLDARQIERLSTTADNYMPSAGVVVRLLAWTGIR